MAITLSISGGTLKIQQPGENDRFLSANNGDFRKENDTYILEDNVTKEQIWLGDWSNVVGMSSETDLIKYLSNFFSVQQVKTGLSIAKGDVPGHSVIHKFGAAPDFDTADNEVTIWDGAEDGTAWEQMEYNYSTSADIDSISSSDQLNDIGIEIEVQGLDSNYELVIQTVTLDATDARTRVVLTTPLIRIFRAKNISSTDLTGHVFIYPNTALTAGVPTDTTKIRCIIQPDNNQTEMALYTIPAGKTGYLQSWYATTAGENKTTKYVVKLKARPYGEVFQLKHRSSIEDKGSSHVQHIYTTPLKYTEKTDIEMTAQMTAGGVTGGAVAAGFDIILVDN